MLYSCPASLVVPKQKTPLSIMASDNSGESKRRRLENTPETLGLPPEPSRPSSPGPSQSEWVPNQPEPTLQGWLPTTGPPGGTPPHHDPDPEVHTWEPSAPEPEANFWQFHEPDQTIQDWEPNAEPEPLLDQEPDFFNYDYEDFYNLLLEEEDESLPASDTPLYSGAHITLHQSLVSILTVVLAFKLSGACLKAILDLINLHIPKAGNVFKSSLYFFKNYFSHIQGPKEFERYCSECFVKCQDKCLNRACQGSKICHLVKISLVSQLETLFKRESFYSKLRFSNEDHQPGDYSDIYDGEIYQQQVKNGFLGKPNNISFQWYTDGAALYTSSKISVWPLYFTINELDYSDRCKKQNLLVPAVWCGPVKPPANLLFTAVYPELVSLLKGVKLEVHGHGEELVRGIVLCGTGDTPARSLMLNMVQFNGAYSCQSCEQQGEPRENCPGVRLFPYKPIEMIPRSVDKMIRYGKMASSEKPHMGCKGPAALAKICPNFVGGTAIDPMHQAYGGVGKTIIKLLTSSDYKSEKWSVRNHLGILDNILLQIKPPHHVPRTNKTLLETAYWKMSMWKSFLLDHSLPVFQSVLAPNYLKHHASLVCAMQMLSADVVPAHSIATARALLHKYIAQFADLYGKNFLTVNLHLLLHLPDVVQNLGPTWVYTCFPFESINGVLLNLVHGTRWAEKQIASSVQMVLGLPDMVSNMAEGESKEFCKKIVGPHRKNYKVVNGCKIFGGYKKVDDLPPKILDFLQDNNIEQSTVIKFNYLQKGMFIYEGTEKKNVTCRDSSAASYINNSIHKVGILKQFFMVKTCHCEIGCNCDCKILAEIKELKKVKDFPTLLDDTVVPNTHQYEPTENTDLVEHVCLKNVGTKIRVYEKLFVSIQSNSKEIE